MKLAIPYYSQFFDVTDALWQPRACGVSCLKMLIEARGLKTPSLDMMIADGIILGAYSENGWLHEGLIALGKKYGAELSRKEFRKKDADVETAERLNKEGVEFIVQTLEEGNPIIVSVIKNFEVRDKFHMVVIVGMKKEVGEVQGFYYHDPDHKVREEAENLFVPIDIFRANWRRMVIF
ncbi:hypothetical protein AUJ77_00855 [Candidatus Nomurabacteria bacterium CG1_02_43_90]|uniref:Peptidase C39-like domain-containing protein n=1 Tax=Candidatus Nomurabacteria bacterium CG1_02_43_90 TaxID=1805281 RepID=A0A1J4V4W1_9BACT|nr:MAG: hypothetical protein AUJ77_00855 [Candidatus Nomurabacteria bacterium CG1_02_43_90]